MNPGRRIAWMVLAIAFGATTHAEVIALDNGAMRVEFDSELFAIRYVGVPGGINLLAPFHLPERLRTDGAAHLDPGGITFSLQRGGLPARADGPAEIISKSATEVVALSSSFGDPAMKLHVDLRLDPKTADATLRIEVRTEATQAADAAIVTTTSLAPHVALRVPKSDATIRAALPEAATASLFVDAGESWEMGRPDAVDKSDPAVADFECGTMIIAGDALWERSISTPASGEAAQPWHAQYRRDPENRQRSLQLACPSVTVDLWNQPTLLETWRLSTPGE